MKRGVKESGGAGESHPHAPTDPYVTVSRHTAPIVQPLVKEPSALLYSLVPPISG